MPFFDFAISSQRRLNIAIRATTSFFKGLVRPSSGSIDADWPDTLSGEIFRGLSVRDRAAYLRWAGAVLRQMQELHVATPAKAANRREFFANLPTPLEIDVNDLEYVLPTYRLHEQARSAMKCFLWYLNELWLKMGDGS